MTNVDVEGAEGGGPGLEGATDQVLLRRVKQGSEAAAARLYEKYAHRLRALVRARESPNLARRLDPDDLVQSVFRRFFAAVHHRDYDLPEDKDLWNLLLAIAVNKLHTAEAHHRAACRDVRITVNLDALPPNAAAEALGHEDAAGLLRLSLQEALGRLPEHFRRVVQLRLESYEVTEIAERVGRSKRTVERILHQAFRLLRDYLGDLGSAHGR